MSGQNVARKLLSRELLATTVRRNPNLYELAKTLPEYGIGSKFAKQSWIRDRGEGESEKKKTFWTLTKIRPKTNGRTGKWAYGVMTWKGRTLERVERIRGTHKRAWCVVEEAEGERREEDGDDEDDVVFCGTPSLEAPPALDTRLKEDEGHDNNNS